MPTPIGYTVLASIRDALKTINGGTQYNHNLTTGNKVFLGRRRGSGDYPQVEIFFARNESSTDTAGAGAILGTYENTMTLVLECAIREGDESEAHEAIWGLYHDVVKKLMADHDRGDKAHDTEVTAFEYHGTDSDSVHQFTIEVQARYLHASKDPASTAPTTA